jgi:hypothetical protein
MILLMAMQGRLGGSETVAKGHSKLANLKENYQARVHSGQMVFMVIRQGD